MAICKYFQSGKCNYGDKCRYEHKKTGGQSGGNQRKGQKKGQFNKNIFQNDRRSQQGKKGRNNAHSNWENNWQSSSQLGDPFQNGPGNAAPFYHMPITSINYMWPLSCLGRSEDPEGGNLIDIDVSPEEIRVMAYQIVSNGSEADVRKKETTLVEEFSAESERYFRQYGEAFRRYQNSAEGEGWIVYSSNHLHTYVLLAFNYQIHSNHSIQSLYTLFSIDQKSDNFLDVLRAWWFYSKWEPYWFICGFIGEVKLYKYEHIH